jgi:hypothetical protein
MRRLLFLAVPVVILGGLVLVPAAKADVDDLPAPPPPAFVMRQPVRVGGGLARPAESSTPAMSDEEALKKADLNPTNGKQLLDYLKQRTLSDVDQGKIQAIIARFGADDFEERLKATEEIERFGPAAVGPLKKAERDSDYEVAYRARLALKRVETVPHSAVAAAAVRAVVKLKPEGAAAVLIGFLPLADTDSLADAIRGALISLAVKDGKADPAIVAALDDKSPLRRAAAYAALTEGGVQTERIRVKDAYPKLREAVLKETDPEAKFAGLWSLTLITREREYIPALIDLIPKLGRGRLWQLEELLLLIAGNHPKDGRFLKSPESLVKTRDAWLAWWKEKGEKIDLTKTEYKPRLLGVMDIIEMDYRGYGQWRIVSLGPDMKEKWRINGVNNPTDVKVAPNGNIWVAEANNNQVTEWDTTGKVLNRRNAFQTPVNLELTSDGGMVVVCRNNILKWDKDGKQLWTHGRQNYDAIAGRLLPNGELVFVTSARQAPGNNGGPNCFFLDAKGVLTKKNHQFAWIQQPQGMDIIGEDKLLVCERDYKNPGQIIERVSEYDLKSGKQTWKYDCPQNSAPTSCQRLPNGNTLICLMNRNQLIEVDPSGEIVWDYQAKDGLKVGRAYRR